MFTLFVYFYFFAGNLVDNNNVYDGVVVSPRLYNIIMCTMCTQERIPPTYLPIPAILYGDRWARNIKYYNTYFYYYAVFICGELCRFGTRISLSHRDTHELLRVTYQYFGRFLFIYLMDSQLGKGVYPWWGGRVRARRVRVELCHCYSSSRSVSFRSIFTVARGFRSICSVVQQ